MRAASMCVRVVVVLAIFVVINPSSPAQAQAWLPPVGEGTLTLGYQLMSSDEHLLSSDALDAAPNVNGDRGKWGDITGQNFALAVDYGIFDRFAASAEVAYIQGGV